MDKLKEQQQQQQHKSGVFGRSLGKLQQPREIPTFLLHFWKWNFAFGLSLWISLPKNHKENNKEGKQLRGLGFLGGDEANLRKTF